MECTNFFLPMIGIGMRNNKNNKNYTNKNSYITNYFICLYVYDCWNDLFILKNKNRNK